MNRGDLARRRRSALALAFCFAAPWGAATSGAANAPGTDPASPLASRAFFRPELSIRATLVRQEASTGAPGGEVWEAFRARYGDEVQVFVDSWSGTPATIVARIPLIPGDGQGNRVALADLGRRLGREVAQVDERAVSDAFLSFVRQNQAAFGLDLGQLGAARAAEARPGLWQVHVPQVYQGIPVRHGRLAATISGGNLVLSGTETWSNVKLDIRPRVTAEDALAAGFAHAGGRAVEDEVVAKPALAVVPFASQSEDGAPAYGHRLVWAFTFQRPPQMEVWEVLTDAHSGEVIAFEDTNHPVRRPMTGNAYPVTSTEQCTSATLCGVMRNVPMPFADTGLAFPNHLTNSAGLFTDTLGAVTTTLSGRFVNINDNCGPTSEAAASGALSLGGATGEHDCETPSGASAGNTASARGVFYELNKWAEVARGWLPTLPFLQNTLPANVNIAQTCNAFWSSATQSVNFYRSGGGCRNSGELAAVIYHEVGHGLDDNDANGFLSNSSEGYADIAAIYRQGSSCVGYGFFETVDPGCGTTADGTGFNANERQTAGGTHCNLELLRRARRGLDPARRPDAGHAPQLRLRFLPDRLGALRPAGALRGRARPPGGLGPGVARPGGRPVQHELQRGAHRGQQAVLRGQRQRRQLVRVQLLGLHLRRLRRLQWLHAVAGRRRRQREPQRRHAPHDRHLQRLPPPRHRLLGPASAPERRLRGAAHAGAGGDPDARGQPHGARLERGAQRHRVLGLPQRGKQRLRHGQGAHRPGHRHRLHRPGGGRPALVLLLGHGGGSERPVPGPGQPLRLRGGDRHALLQPGLVLAHPTRAADRVVRGHHQPGAAHRGRLTELPEPAFAGELRVLAGDGQPAGRGAGRLAAHHHRGHQPGGWVGGTFASKVVANYGGGVIREFPISISVSGGLPTFTLTCDQTDLFLLQDTSTTTFCRVRSHNGFASPVSLACNPANASGVTCSVSPASVTPPANGTAAVTLRLRAARLAPPGFRSFSVRGISGATTRTVGITVEVDVNDLPF